VHRLIKKSLTKIFAEYMKQFLFFAVGLPAAVIVGLKINDTLGIIIAIGIMVFVVIASFSGGNGFDGRGRDD
jgi:hypothetical protein